MAGLKIQEVKPPLGDWAMTDLLQLLSVLASFGIYPKVEKGFTQALVRVKNGDKIRGKDYEVSGYSEFFTDFWFDLEGNFINMGAWE